MTPWVSTRTRTTTRAGRGNVLDESMHEEGVAVHVLADGVERALGDDIRVADATEQVGLAELAHVGHHETGGDRLHGDAVLLVPAVAHDTSV